MLDTTGFQLTEKQVEQRDLAASVARHVLAFGGSRSGKTFGFCRCIATRALMAPGSRHVIARLHNIDARQAVMMDTFPAMMRLCYPEVVYTPNKVDQFALLPNNAEIWFAGLDDKERVEKILGKEYVTIYINEASQVSYDAVNTLRTRLAQNVRKANGERLALKAYYDLNPTGKKHWTYLEFIEGVRPDNRKTKLPEGQRAYLVMNPTDNPNLPPEYLDELAQLPERMRQRFLDGKYLSEVPGTLWPTDRIDACRVDEAPQLTRIVVAVDPSGGGDDIGIMVMGLGIDGHGYVLEDATCSLSPAGWGRRVVEMYDKWDADRVVAESNYGGDMVKSNIQTTDDRVPVTMVTATRGKHVRAEPVASLYEQTVDGNGNVVKEVRVHHVGEFDDLEDQMSMFTTSGYSGSGSPDRADALVWAVTELMLGEKSYVQDLVL